MAFRNLPPFASFIAARQDKAFDLRVEFEASADALHERFIKERRIDAERELQLHVQHIEKKEGRVLEKSELVQYIVRAKRKILDGVWL